MTNFLRSILKVFACYKTSAFFPTKSNYFARFLISTPSSTGSSKLILAHRKEGRFFTKRAFKLNLGLNGEKWFGDLRIDRTSRKARECSRDRRRLSEGGFQRVPVSEELLPSPSRPPSLSLPTSTALGARANDGCVVLLRHGQPIIELNTVGCPKNVVTDVGAYATMIQKHRKSQLRLKDSRVLLRFSVNLSSHNNINNFMAIHLRMELILNEIRIRKESERKL